ncbi:unnamed protein product [Didymodactylos carnosus]|uniref:Uncharacterized protein n=1 Tax=Didymodactylos carnosus TaxID=1234261 RepID=A0A814X460_9BILA|nr:unnamed protein product [Didymodactylos carnosus]CAF1206379.1 unnamed protein product [Didymodactylos carnosus]CAF3747086.1 unnamed protein product [Didymodactylos carnosus]CAF3970682.1 unnamed protein product [Didymodactylos carnosus]
MDDDKNYVTTIEMHPDDQFIVKNYGQLPDYIRTSNLKYTYDLIEEFLYVGVMGSSESKEFKLGKTSVKDIEQ